MPLSTTFPVAYTLPLAEREQPWEYNIRVRSRQIPVEAINPATIFIFEGRNRPWINPLFLNFAVPNLNSLYQVFDLAELHPNSFIVHRRYYAFVQIKKSHLIRHSPPCAASA